MKDKQSGIRRAVIGLYSDGVKMSVSEQAENGQWFCLHRSEEEEDFFAQNGEIDTEKLTESVKRSEELARKLLCEEIVLVGYGLLRYDPNLRQELEEQLNRPVLAVSGREQAKAAWQGMAHSGEIGMNSRDFSTQLFYNDPQLSVRESFPLGWRAVWQGSVLIPNRFQEAQMRQKAANLLQESGFLKTGEPRDTRLVKAGGMESAAKFLFLTAGESETLRDELTFSRETLERVMRWMREPSLRWTGALERVGGRFPQKVYCQLLILSSVMEYLQADSAQLCRIFLEDGYLGVREEIGSICTLS